MCNNNAVLDHKEDNQKRGDPAWQLLFWMHKNGDTKQFLRDNSRP